MLTAIDETLRLKYVYHIKAQFGHYDTYPIHIKNQIELKESSIYF